MTREEAVQEIEQVEVVIKKLEELRADFLQRLEDLRAAVATGDQGQDGDQ